MQANIHDNPNDGSPRRPSDYSTPTTQHLVHMYSPTRRRLGYEANWWKRKPDGEWEVVPLNPKAASLLKPLTQLVDCREIFAKGKISDKGIISEDLKTQLHSRGVFEPSSSASPPAQGAMQ